MEQMYINWIEKHLSWLCNNSTKIGDVRIYLADLKDGILNADNENEIKSCSKDERRQFEVLYSKVKAAGFSKIGVIITALEETKQTKIAEEFKILKQIIEKSTEDSDEIDFLSCNVPLIVTVKSGKRVPSSNEVYKMTSSPRGLALIIHNENYCRSDMVIRKGATNDLHYMMNLFNQLNYQIVLHRDVNSYELEGFIEDFQSKFLEAKVDSCVVICMGHGERQEFIMVDNNPINIWTDLIYKFDNESASQIAGKPKIFIFQACQVFSGSGRVVRDSSYDQPEPSAIHCSDILVCFSTIPGKPAFRDTYIGSWYIYCLAETFMNNAHDTDIENLLKMTNKRMAGIRDGDLLQVSSWQPVSFDKRFYFNV